MSSGRCCCFTLHQGSLVVSMILALLYGLASLAVLVDLCLAVRRDGPVVVGCEAATLTILLLQLAAAVLLGRAVQSNSQQLVLVWLVWHAVWWLLGAMLTVSAVTAGALLLADPAAPAVGGTLMVLLFVLLAYTWSVALRLYMSVSRKERLSAQQLAAPA